MKIEDIKIGETYQLTFTPQVSKITIFGYPGSKSSPMTLAFHKKYAGREWGSHQDRKVIVLDKTTHFPPGVRFRFENDPTGCNIVIYPDYFKSDGSVKPTEKYMSPFSGKLV